MPQTDKEIAVAIAMKARGSPLRGRMSVPKEHFINNPRTIDEARIARLAKVYNAKNQEQRNKQFLATKERYSEKYDLYFFRPDYKKLENEYRKLDYGDPEKKEIGDKMDAVRDEYKENEWKMKRERKRLALQSASLGRHAGLNNYRVEVVLENPDAKKLNEYMYDDDFGEKQAKRVKGFNPKLTPKYIEDEKWQLWNKVHDEQEPVRIQWSKDMEAMSQRHHQRYEDARKDPNYLTNGVSEKFYDEHKKEQEELVAKFEKDMDRVVEKHGYKPDTN